MNVKELQEAIHQNAVDHGWWEKSIPVPEMLCRIHEEVSEALRAYRNNDPDLFAEELADIAMMALSAAGGYGIDLESEIIRKHEINKKRPYRHGGKAC